MVDDAHPTAPDGPMLVDVRLNVAWTVVILAMGVAVVALGGLMV